MKSIISLFMNKNNVIKLLIASVLVFSLTMMILSLTNDLNSHYSIFPEWIVIVIYIIFFLISVLVSFGNSKRVMIGASIITIFLLIPVLIGNVGITYVLIGLAFVVGINAVLVFCNLK